jgi:hypothetical protein
METPDRATGIRPALLNLALVALLGTLLRYKIAFYFPQVQQKNLLYAHYHFAFTGWLAHALYAAFTSRMLPVLTLQRQQRYKLLLRFNLVAAWGWLLSFVWQGYGVLAILFSLLGLLVAVVFAVSFTKDARGLPPQVLPANWAGTALWL